jgi:hypothetical protein
MLNLLQIRCGAAVRLPERRQCERLIVGDRLIDGEFLTSSMSPADRTGDANQLISGFAERMNRRCDH